MTYVFLESLRLGELMRVIKIHWVVMRMEMKSTNLFRVSRTGNDLHLVYFSP